MKIRMKTNKKFFDETAEEYDRHMARTNHYNAQSELLKRFDTKIKEPILDIACGSGHVLKDLARKHSNILGNDFSQVMVKKARSNLPSVEFTCEDAAILKTIKTKFNTLICCNLLFYLKDPYKAISRWKELLSQKGTLIVLEECPFTFPQGDHFADQFKPGKIAIKPISTSSLIELFKQNKLEVLQVEKTPIDRNHNLYGFILKKNETVKEINRMKNISSAKN